MEELRDALNNPDEARLLGEVVRSLEPATIRRLADLINAARVETIRKYARTVEIETSRIRAGHVHALHAERFGEVNRHG